MLGVSAHFSFNNLKMAIFNRNKLANTFFEYFFFSTQLPEDNNVLTHATNYSGRIWYAEFGNWLMGVLGHINLRMRRMPNERYLLLLIILKLCSETFPTWSV